MLKYVKYFLYLFKHKAYVFYYCCKLGIWHRGIFHDWDKVLLPEIFIPYANATFGPGRSVNYGLKDGMPDYEIMDIKFFFAVMQHKRRNNHHPEAFQSILKPGYCYEMPKECVLEMIADWFAANKMHKDFHGSYEWYWENRNKIKLHRKTRRLVEFLLLKLTVKWGL